MTDSLANGDTEAPAVPTAPCPDDNCNAEFSDGLKAVSHQQVKHRR